jgi:hypothetical protein
MLIRKLPDCGLPDWPVAALAGPMIVGVIPTVARLVIRLCPKRLRRAGS